MRADRILRFVQAIPSLFFVCAFVLTHGEQVKAVPPSEENIAETPVSYPEESPANVAAQQGLVEMDFDNVDIVLFIKFVGEVTGKNFVIDPRVKGKVTIVSPRKIPVEEVYKVFQSVLEVHGFTTMAAGSIIKIVPSAEARAKGVEVQ